MGIPFPRPRLTLDSYFSNGANRTARIRPGASAFLPGFSVGNPSTVPVNGTLALIMLLSDKQDNFDHRCRLPAGVVVLASVAVSQAGPQDARPTPRPTIGRQSVQRALRGQGSSAAVVRQIVSAARTAVSHDSFHFPPGRT